MQNMILKLTKPIKTGKKFVKNECEMYRIR